MECSINRVPAAAALVILLVACLSVVQAGNVSDVELDARIMTDDFAAVRAAAGDGPDWTARVLSIGEEQGDLLTMAAMHGAPRVAAGLLQAGAAVNGNRDRRNVWGYSPLYLAAREGHVPVARLLVAAGADIGRTDHAGFAPMHVAAAFGRLEIVKLLLDAGVPVDAAAARGDTALMLAVMRRHDDTARYLLSRHADPNLADGRGDTPLHEAARNNAASLVPALLAHGARLLPNRYHRTAADEARDWAADLLPLFRPLDR
jgi:ankyrin repeat protein